MKKVLFLLVFSFSLTAIAKAVNPAYVIQDTVESRNLGAPNDTVPVFKIGPISFITDNSGSKEYKNGWIRNAVEWCLYRSYNDGTLLVKADEGYWMKDVTFYYSNCKSGGMLADTAGAGQQKIAAYDSAKAIVVNGPEKQFYVGKTSAGNGGYLAITQFAVSYYKTPDSLALEDISVKAGETFQLTPKTFPVGSDTIYAWSSDNSKVVSVDKNGVIAAKSEGQATITVMAGKLRAECTVSVTKDASAGFVETFSNCLVTKNYTGTTKVKGDHQLYQWKVTNFQRQTSGTEDKVNGSQGIRVRYSGSIAMDSIQEGGVKAVAFDWRTPNSVNVINYSVNVGGSRYEYNSAAIPSATVSHFERYFEVKENTAFSFDMAPKMGSDGQCYVIVGPITITPYLLFSAENHLDTVRVGASGSYNLNDVLINNTGEAPMFSIMKNTTGATTDIVDGVLSISGKTQPGEIAVEAAWNNNKVTTRMTLYVENPLPFVGDSIIETFSQCYTTQMFDGRVHVVGDNGIYDWSVKNFQRVGGVDTINGQQGIRVRYNGSIASSGAQEGGVKQIAFDWRATGVDNPIHFMVQVDSLSYDYSSAPVPMAAVMHFVRPCRVRKNATMKISVPAEENPSQSYIIVGPLTITPYLLFSVPDHTDTLRMAEANSYDLREVLIDNTDTTGVSYEILSDSTGVATLEGSVVVLGEVSKSGAVELQASWGEVTTTMTLWVEANPPLSLTGCNDATIPQCTKVLVDDHFYIMRGARVYDIQGNVKQ